MIETVCVCVFMYVLCVRVFVCTEWQGDVCHYNGRTAPPWLPAICSQAPHFKWIFGVCCFTTYPVCTAPLAILIDRGPSFSPLSLDLCLSHPKSTESDLSMQSLAISGSGRLWTEATAAGNKTIIKQSAKNTDNLWESDMTVSQASR